MLAATSALILTIVMGTKAVMSDGKATFCYVKIREDAPTVFVLYQNIPWQPDHVVGKFFSIEETVKAAELTKCPVEIVP